MIYQTKSSILTELLSLEGRQATRSHCVLDDILNFKDKGCQTELGARVSNDRTQLKHQK